jgi:hypothetical protein
MTNKYWPDTEAELTGFEYIGSLPPKYENSRIGASLYDLYIDSRSGTVACVMGNRYSNQLVQGDVISGMWKAILIGVAIYAPEFYGMYVKS